jgi:general secretion pathway protein I
MRIQNLKSKIQNGFTLLEVVVAMAIVGLGVVTLFEIFSSGLRLETKSSERTLAVAYSRQALDGFLSRRALQEGGEAGNAQGGYRWSIEVRPFQDDSRLSVAGWELKEVRLRMRYHEGGREQEAELKTLRLLKKKNP